MTVLSQYRGQRRLVTPDHEPMVGLLAGSGRFPILFAEAARRQGLKVACVGIKYEAPAELRDLCETFEIAGVAKLGRMIRLFKQWQVREIVMAGKVTKNVMYTPWRHASALPGPADGPDVVLPQPQGQP